MASMVDRMLDQAAGLIRDNPDSAAAKRRAVSSAYYAAFHALMNLCAREILPEGDVGSPEFERVYRQIDHGPLKSVFQSEGPLKGRPSLQRIGDDIVVLQDARKLADYAPPRPFVFTRSKAEEHVDRARAIVSQIADLSREDRRTLAVHLLFPARKK